MLLQGEITWVISCAAEVSTHSGIAGPVTATQHLTRTVLAETECIAGHNGMRLAGLFP